MAGITTVSLSTMVTPAMRAELGRLRDEDRVSEGDVTRAALGSSNSRSTLMTGMPDS